MINGIYSDWVPLKCDVPQSSALLALLFIVYVNGISILIISNTALFADDTKVFYLLTKLHSHIQLQNDILIFWLTGQLNGG